MPILGNKDIKGVKGTSSYVSYSNLGYIYIGASR